MQRRIVLIAVAAALVLSGCLGDGGGLDELGPTSGSPDGDDAPVDEPTTTGGNGTQPSDDGNSTSSSNRTEGPPDDGNETDEPTEEEAAYPAWPPLARASVRPGVQVLVDGAQCTSNFLFRTPNNSTLMLGVAAHCVADGAQTNTNGCDTSNEPKAMGTEVQIEGASQPGILVYSSWLAMQADDEDSAAICRANDFALIAVHDDDRSNVHPAVEHFGGPTGLASVSAAAIGDKVLTYGDSGLRMGMEASNWHEGYVVQRPNDWSVWTYTVAPGVPGDSGSGVMTGDGRALGVLSTIAITPMPASNGVGALDKQIEYASDVAGLEVELVTWDLLDPGLLP